MPAPEKRRVWTDERKARLIELFFRGYALEAIAADPCMRMTVKAVHHQLNRLGYTLADRPKYVVLRDDIKSIFRDAGRPWGMSPELALESFVYHFVSEEQRKGHDPIRYIAAMIDGDRAPPYIPEDAR
jgi:hypothetical protein